MFWTSLERRTSRTNKDTVSHPPHGHDDIATSVAGVSVNALDSTLNTVVVESLWDVFARSRQDRQIDDKEENFRLAEEADRRGSCGRVIACGYSPSASGAGGRDDERGDGSIPGVAEEISRPGAFEKALRHAATPHPARIEFATNR
jgi:hypothetical protein